ncbi:MAG TPA: aminotransferase class III-fold pyridoxal phosphate-dependent enzyme [Steroidobacteraceae bacterium]|nr:aminotransferase class III-fold pyridoxal phosphate-dependent enzyme [Steroidobacteraceae bacterium]
MARGVGSGFGLRDLPRISHGSGSYLYDEAGRAYLDGSGGPAVFCLGHAHPEVNAAISAQLQSIAHAYRYLFTSAALESLTEVVLRVSGNCFQDVLYSADGSEAVESALKVALQHFAARGLMKKRRFIARQRSWHGNTLGALSVSGFASRRQAFEGSLLEVIFVSAANAYRPPEGCPPGALSAHLAGELEQAIQAAGPDRVAAFIFEPIVGAAGGVVPAPPGYAAAVQAVCRKYDVLLIADEVMCGSGRSGTWRALEHDGVVPDIMSIAKGLAGGYIPLGATLVAAQVSMPILSEHGAFMTGHTFSGHTAACAAGLAVQRIIERERLIERVRVVGAAFQDSLRERLSRFEEVGDVRGRGFFIGIELVRDRGTRAPFPAQRGLSLDVGRRAFAGGLICYPCSGNVDGAAGDTVILAPPYNASDAELEQIAVKLEQALEAALAGGKASGHRPAGSAR